MPEDSRKRELEKLIEQSWDEASESCRGSLDSQEFEEAWRESLCRCLMSAAWLDPDDSGHIGLFWSVFSSFVDRKLEEIHER